MTYHAPHTLEQALAHLAGGGANVIAGCTDYFPALPKGRVDEALVDITRITGLRAITRERNGWRIGAATTWSDVIKADLPASFDGLKVAATQVGSVQIQNVGTLVGNIVNASPAADGVPALLVLEAQVEIASQCGTRFCALENFITGVRKTALKAGEIVTAILIPPQPEGAFSTFEKLGSRKYLVISITMVSALIKLDREARINVVRLAVGACSPVACRQFDLEASLFGHRAADVRITPEMLQGLSPIEDVRGDAAYRMIAAAEQCERAIRQAVKS